MIIHNVHKKLVVGGNARLTDDRCRLTRPKRSLGNSLHEMNILLTNIFTIDK